MRFASFVLVLASVSLNAEVKIEPVPGQTQFAAEYSGASDFSGLTWLRGDLYFAVSNREKAIFPLRLEVEATGKIINAKFSQPSAVKAPADDFEAIAYVPRTKRLYISTEKPAGVFATDTEGDAIFRFGVPKIFETARRNKALESLGYGAGSFWTANEDTLEADGSMSSAAQGALVRLQKFDEKFKPTAQFAYRTDTSLMRVANSGTGVTDLAVLPTGDVLVLERVVGLGLIARIYLVRFEGATDTANLRSLDGADFTPVKKTLLFEQHAGRDNYEGICLGPELADGWRSLILLADNGGGSKHPMIPLRVKF